MTLDVHVVSHTHWDREWYHPVERFRQRLVALVDELLERPPRGDESFLLDGQAIIIEDYLAVRPDRAHDLRALLGARRLEAGPWYVLADELIPSGEALVRNLLAGARALHRLGAAPPPVLYCPDSFGHPAALPAIAAGFGLPLIILWRGLGGARAPRGDTFRWISPGGDEAIVYHLPRDGYEYGSHLPANPDEARARWSRMRAELAPRATTGVVLIPNGADHHAPQLRLAEAVRALIDAAGDDRVRRSSLSAFAEHVVERADAQHLPRLGGELRDSYGYTWTLQGTFATRAHEKRANAQAERALLREAEPWSAIAARLGVARAARRPLVEAAWRTLLEAHPHDTLCGCSIDDVARAMELRVRSAHNQSDGIRDDAGLDLVGHDSVEARTAADRWRPVALVRNAAARARGGVALVDVEEFIADVAVGPGSAAGSPPATVRSERIVIEGLGRVQILARSLTNRRIESPRHYPDNDLVAVTRVAVWVPEVPAYGIAGFAIGGSETARQAVDRVTTGARAIENARLKVSVSGDGAVELTDKENGRTIASLLAVVDDADAGDTYTAAPRPRGFRVDVKRVRRVHRGPLVGALAMTMKVVDTETRSVDADLEVHLSLRSGEPFLRIDVAGINARENHRLRLRVHGDVPGAEVWADAAFGPVRRSPIAISEEDARVEHAPATAPLHRYVSSFNGVDGLTVFSDGLAEYEALEDGGFAVTLVRAVGELSRNDLPERPGHAGWPTPTPGAQCLGPFAASFAVALHGPRRARTIDEIEAMADAALLPLAGFTLRSALAVPDVVRGPELVGDGLALSAIKESENGEWLVLRCVNLRDEPARGEWRLPFAVRQAALARLDETIMSDVETRRDAVPVEAPPHGIVTVLVR